MAKLFGQKAKSLTENLMDIGNSIGLMALSSVRDILQMANLLENGLPITRKVNLIREQ